MTLQLRLLKKMHKSLLSGQLLPKGSTFQYVCSEGCETAG